MPKVLIREYEQSTTGIPASDNFAVVVPGYFGEHAGDESKVSLGYDVYELKSQQDFITYVGKHAGSAREKEPPQLQVVNTADDANEYTKYKKYLIQDDFVTDGGCIYRIEEILSNTDHRYGKDGYLYTTISYKDKSPVYVTDGEGNPTAEIEKWVEVGEEKTVTVAFVPVEFPSEVDWEEYTEGESDPYLRSSDDNYCIIEKGHEGTDAIQEPHIGNQIAYELLGLGYTVLYKKLTRNSELNEATFWEPLKDKSVFNFRYVMTGGYYTAAAMNQICQLADFNNNTTIEEADTYGNLAGRGDCIALCDIDENMSGHEVNASKSMREILENIGYSAKAISSANQYAAIFGPKVEYVMSDKAVEDFGGNKTFPASFHYLACAARTFDRYKEWYAVAGYNRGVSSYSIETTSVKLGEIAINTLAPRITNGYTTKSVNLILHERGNYYLWGNRTGYALDNKGIVFRHFLNIRQLCCSIKKQLYTACRQFTFDPNSDLLWINFVNAIKPTLEAMKADQGIKGYTISRVADDKKALLKARIRIVPIEAVEDFDISIYLEDSLTGIVVSADETLA